MHNHTRQTTIHRSFEYVLQYTTVRHTHTHTDTHHVQCELKRFPRTADTVTKRNEHQIELTSTQTQHEQWMQCCKALSDFYHKHNKKRGVCLLRKLDCGIAANGAVRSNDFDRIIGRANFVNLNTMSVNKMSAGFRHKNSEVLCILSTVAAYIFAK